MLFITKSLFRKFLCVITYAAAYDDCVKMYIVIYLYYNYTIAQFPVRIRVRMSPQYPWLVVRGGKSERSLG